MTLPHPSFSLPITAQLFPIAAPFPVISVLKIPLDNRQMKSFENFNILIEVALFCLKKLFFRKKAFIWKKNTFLKKNYKRFFWKKTYLKQKFFFGKILLKKKNCLKWHLKVWHLKAQVRPGALDVQVPGSPGAWKSRCIKFLRINIPHLNVCA